MQDNEILMVRFVATAAQSVSGDASDRAERLQARMATLTALGDAISATPDGRTMLERVTRAPASPKTRFAAARIVEAWDRELAEICYTSLVSATGRPPERPMTTTQAWLYQSLGNQEAFAAALRLNILDGS